MSIWTHTYVYRGVRRLTACTHVGHIQSKYNSYNSYNARAPGLNAQTNDAVTDAESQMLLVVEQVAAAHIAV